MGSLLMRVFPLAGLGRHASDDNPTVLDIRAYLLADAAAHSGGLLSLVGTLQKRIRLIPSIGRDSTIGTGPALSPPFNDGARGCKPTVTSSVTALESDTEGDRPCSLSK